VSVAVAVAAAACVIALGAFGLAFMAWRALGRVRRDQRLLLGDSGATLVEFAVNLQTRLDDLNGAVDEVAAALARVDRRVDTTVSKMAVVRYDAYEAHGGHQSSTVALLDAERSGVVVSAIQGRDYARIYVKEVDRGRAAIALSPEEEEAVQRAMAR
jgi:Protein of unknown function (DUF4446)